MKHIRVFLCLTVCAIAILGIGGGPRAALAEDLGWVSLGQVTKIGVHRSGYVAFNPGATGALVWTCPTRWYAISGGFDTLAAKGFRLVESYPQRVGPDVGFRQWKLRLKNLDNAGKQYARIWVVCGN